jgi:hypothetical protein
VRHLSKRSIDKLLTGDESWFDYDYAHDLAWAALRATLPTRMSRTIHTKNAWFPLFGRRPVSTVFLRCLLGCGTMQSSFAHTFFLASKGNYVRPLAERPVEASICILTMRQLTMPNDRDKTSPEPKPGGCPFGGFSRCCTQRLLIVWPSEARDGRIHSELTKRCSFRNPPELRRNLKKDRQGRL